LGCLCHGGKAPGRPEGKPLTSRENKKSPKGGKNKFPEDVGGVGTGESNLAESDKTKKTKTVKKKKKIAYKKLRSGLTPKSF